MPALKKVKSTNELETLIYGQGFKETDIIKLTLTMLFYSDVNSRINRTASSTTIA